MITAIAYVRVSTEEQAAEGVSVDAQVASVRAYAALRGLELVDVVVDAGVSAGKPLADRVGGAVVVDAVKRRKVRAIIGVKLDRVFRNAGDCLTVTEEDQRIRWRLDPESRNKWRLVGLCWCGDDQPPTGEFRDWLKEKDRISATDRNETAGEWRYGLLYRDKKEKNSAPPRVFDPAIRNRPQQ
jgi:hypothetical protein